MLAAVSDELQDLILPGRIERVTQPSPHEIVIHVFAHTRKRQLYLSVDPMYARVHLTTNGKPNPTTPPSFCMLLRKYLEGGWLEGCEHPFGLGERVIRLTVLGGQARYRLYVELMGKHSNIVLTTESDMILGAAKIITAQVSRFREIKPGIKYFAPPRMKSTKRDAFAGDAGVDIPARQFDSADEAQAWLMSTFSGLSPLMAAEGVARAEGTPLTAESVWYGLNEVLNSARLREFAPVQYDENDGLTRAAYPINLLTHPHALQETWSSFNKALDNAYQTVELADAFLRERSAITGALRRALKTCEKEQVDTEEGLANAERADEYKEIGDLLLSSLHKVPANASEVVLEDYFAAIGAAERTIALDPRLGARENAERYYRKHQKARDAMDRLTERLATLEEVEASLQTALDHAESATTLAEIEKLNAGLGDEIARRLRQIPSAEAEEAHATENDIFAGHKIRRVRSVDGWEILVGENATSNDYLTTRIAAPNDIWLHARAVTSAHAIIRSQNRPATVSSAALRLAAEQVARRSDAKHARLVAVDYTLKKYVRKPRRAAPGAVTYTNEKTLDVTPASA